MAKLKAIKPPPDDDYARRSRIVADMRAERSRLSRFGGPLVPAAVHRFYQAVWRREDARVRAAEAEAATLRGRIRIVWLKILATMFGRPEPYVDPNDDLEWRKSYHFPTTRGIP